MSDCDHHRLKQTYDRDSFGPVSCPDCGATHLVTPDGELVVVSGVVGMGASGMFEPLPDDPMGDTFDGERSAAAALEHIREGGSRLVALALDRISQLEAAISEGDFNRAVNHLGEIDAKIRPLAFAQHHLGMFRSDRIIKRGRELEVGDYPLRWGRIESIEPGEVPEKEGERATFKVRCEGDDSEIEVDGEQEIIVWSS